MFVKVPEVTLQMIFFDGEEAFISWTGKIVKFR
jgi:hypothetical protein